MGKDSKKTQARDTAKLRNRIDEIKRESGAEALAVAVRDIETSVEFDYESGRVSDPFSLRLIGSVLRGRVPSLLDLDERPEGYNDIGRLCRWDNLFSERVLPRSRYERVLIRAIRGEELHMNGFWYKPTGMKGWSRVVFRRREDGTRHVFSLDYLLDHLAAWEKNGATRRGKPSAIRTRRAARLAPSASRRNPSSEIPG